ncbi:BZ3500_MvSof-1268-A1-R1_Chr2-1g04577 [Microbotryum saponariae]|uniref:BZ3500_MvSof-1268-A1-R1_Chr2-1g04577 protein n=1 Tax=Microbotryum saponariae TaxID=289078 RepID=A0A2X0MC06_9BASI|nr:BZ3500_MvSof-1268-A1-R1_Chr2-1g04577 [Microbotryum saponariae]SCZ92066.1 BZ3501_MvSof-1269-A2-R1_Chr2-1g04233 [Microbotryum saponariae]
MSSSKETKEPSILTSIARHIPGLSISSSSGTGTGTGTSSGTSTSTSSASKKNRGRKPKSQPMTTSVSAAASAADKPDDPNAQLEPAAAPSAFQVPVSVPEVEALGEVEEKKTSAVEACQKRIRAANKKIQRIVTYEEKTEALNADQQRAVASKPALVAVVKELEELLVILKAEEAEDEARDQRNAALEEKRQARAVEAAVASAHSTPDSKVLILLQFLHLHGLYTQQSTGFAPPVLPPVVANATGQEVAAVRMLKERFTSGPLLGGHGDAVEALNKIAGESSEEALPGVPYSRIKELIAGLTSTPADQPLAASNHHDNILPESNAPTGPSDSVTALVDGATDAPAHDAPSFLNASELEQVPSSEAKVASWADEVEANPAVDPVAHEPASTPTPAPAPVEEPAAVAPAVLAADAWGSTTGGTVDWATEDSGALPSLPELQPTAGVAPIAGAGHGATLSVDADGFQAARRGGPAQGQGQGQGRGPRGPPGGGRNGMRGNGEEGGRGGGRGGGQFRGRSDGNWERRGPPPSSQGQGQGQNGPRDDGFIQVTHHNGGDGGHRGRGRPHRGGEGGGRGGGRGPREGGFRGGQGQGQGQNKVERPVGGDAPAANASAAAPAAPTNRW